jgi:mRNA interferase RelE/StbE
MKIVKTKWIFVFSERARKEFSKLDHEIKLRIQKHIKQILASNESPKNYWKKLSGNMNHLYSYHVGFYRIVAEINENQFKIMAVGVGHRKAIYKRF